MPFYGTKQAGDHGYFPQYPPREPIALEDVTPDTEYRLLTREQLIQLCDERGIKSGKVVNGEETPVGRYQKKAYYIEKLQRFDRSQGI